MKTSTILTSFNGGLFSPRLNGRVDIAKYYSSCRTLENMIVYPHGGASRRFGTVFVAETKTSANISRLIPYQFNEEQSYVVEMGHEYLRFYKDNGQIVSGTIATGTPIEVASSYTSSLIDTVRYAQNQDTMRLVNQSVFPCSLTRSSHTAWTLASTTFVSTPSDWGGASGYPGHVGFYEQRSVYAGTIAQPQTMWLSNTGSLNGFDYASGAAADDDSPLTLTLDGNSVIRWLLPGRYLNVGTGESEWVVSSGSGDEAMTPTMRKAKRASRYGSSSTPAVAVANAILFVQRAGRKLRELVYDYVSDSYGDPPDLTIFSEHVTKVGIKSYAFQREPDSILWCVLNDGTIAAFTYNKTQDVTGWHTHSTDGDFESVTTIPVEGYDQVWFIVNRTIGGAAKRYVEYMAPDFGTTQSKCWFVDSGLQYDGSGTKTVTGLDHLEGKLVSILADGAVMPAETVVSGAITISTAASIIIAGLPYTSILEPMDLETKEQSGSGQGKRKKIHNIMVRFYQTLGAKVGSAAGTMDIITFRTASDPMDSAPPLFTGDKVVPFPGGWDRHGYIRITQEQPLPLTVLAIEPLVNTGD